MTSFWREQSRVILLKELADNPGVTAAAFKKKVRDKYPFGERAMHPYKVWLKEVNSICNALEGGREPTPLNIRNFWTTND